MTISCLVTELGRFRQSSKEAVEGLDQFSDFKHYMHVERACERELKEILEEVQTKDKPHLILVCGSVGDGKSHLISFLKNQYPHLFARTRVHNDATESFSPTKTSMDTLREELHHFTDESLAGGVAGPHMVVAINLGTLNNFLNSQYSHEFSKLKKFVDEQKIIDEVRSEYQYDRSLPFRFINLSDYHLYELCESGVKSSFQEQILEKITAHSSDNPFYKVYQESCRNCPVRGKCPVRMNYELISRKQVQMALIQKLAELNIKYKVLVSPRAYLDLLHKALVDKKLALLQSRDQVIEQLSQESLLDQIRALLPNLFYDEVSSAENFSKLQEMQPGTMRTERVDQLAIDFFSSKNPEGIFRKYLESEILDLIGFDSALNEVEWKPEEQNLLYKTLLRLSDLGCASQENDLLEHDEVYAKYLQYLYAWNRGDRRRLKPLYQDVIYAIYHWNGDFGPGKTSIRIGKNQLKIHVCQELRVESKVDELKERSEKTLERFLTHMILHFRVDGSEQGIPVDLDFHLFQLIEKIKKGYRPNHHDRNNFVSFVDFLDRINRAGSHKQKIEFHIHKGTQSRTFSLYRDEFGDYVFQ